MAAVELVVLRATAQDVVAVFAVESVLAGATVEDVIACACVEGVVTIKTRQCVCAGVAVEQIAVGGGRCDLGLDGVDVPDCAVGESELLNLGALGGVTVEIAAHAKRISAAVEPEHEIAALARQCHASSGNAGAQLNHIELAGRAFEGTDGVLARAQAKQIGVVAATAVQ